MILIKVTGWDVVGIPFFAVANFCCFRCCYIPLQLVDSVVATDVAVAIVDVPVNLFAPVVDVPAVDCCCRAYD